MKPYHVPSAIALEAVLLTPEMFRRRFVAWKPDHLVLPPTPLIQQFEFPSNSVYHYVVMDGIQEGPLDSDPRMVKIDRRMPLEAVRTLTRFEGNPTPLAVNLEGSITNWHRMHKRFRRTKDAVLEAPSEQVLAVINYAYLPRLYRYTRSIYTERYRWINTWTTVIDKIAVLAQTSPRTHFIFTDLPQQLPSMVRLENLDGKPDSMIVRTLTTPEDWMFYELWKWADPARRSASIFSRIPAEHLSKLRLVIQDAGRFVCYDFGLLNSWIDQPTSERGARTIKPVEMQKRLLRGLISLMQNRAPNVLDETTGEIDQKAVDAQLDQTQASTLETANVDDSTSTAARIEQLLSELDDDIAQLDVLDQQRQQEQVQQQAAPAEVSQVGVVANFDQPVTTKDVVSKMADDLADAGVLTAPEYRKITKLIEKAVQLPNPYTGDKTLLEFGTVQPEETTLPSAPLIPDQPGLIDPSMREASLKTLDAKYITEFLPRDITGAVTAMQKAGLIINDYTVEPVEDALGQFEIHSVRVVPLTGLPSTLRFKVPMADPTGKIKAGGTEYRYRRQRIDLPIRKISASRVALSSYYGKTFVSRSERTTFDYGRWLQRELALLMVGETPAITQIKTGDVFDRSCTGPRSFTSISERYRSFVCKDIEFHFDWSKQEQVFGLERIAEAKQQGLTLCGRKGETLYAVDEFNTLYEVEPGNATPLDSIETYLGIEAGKAPVEFTECRIFGKNIPTALVLAYYYGLGELIKMLGARVRRVPAGQRLNLQPSEWSVAFEDETLVFSRDDRLATLILGGLRSVEKSTRRYSVYAFDRQAVYLNVLEQQGLSVRYLREFDHLDKLFVDPITERVLKRMGEPVTYRGLLKRANQLLLNDEHPRQLDARYMRWRGMERIAGAVYAEMVQSMREHNAKANKANARVEMKPYAVWKRVMQNDPAMTQVKDINPIQQLKEVEAVTYAGTGGRTSRSMTRESRYYDPTDMGVVSEATSDSKDVAINTYTSGSPRFETLEGMIKDPLFDNTPAVSLLSTSALLSPAAVKDD